VTTLLGLLQSGHLRCLIDLDDTLVDYAAEERSAMLAVGALLPAEIGRDRWKRAYLAGKRQARAARGQTADEHRLRLACAFEAAGLAADPDFVEHAVARYWQARYAHVRLLPGATEVLGLLRRRAEHLCLCTHGVGFRQRDRLRLAGIGGYFDAVRISGDVGATKADWVRFLGPAYTASARYAVISDQMVPDLAAARPGMFTVLVARGAPQGAPAGPRYWPDLHVASLAQLYGHLAPQHHRTAEPEEEVT
jgi:FMN phosphatase YigB (HAD superfamily)